MSEREVREIHHYGYHLTVWATDINVTIEAMADEGGCKIVLTKDDARQLIVALRAFDTTPEGYCDKGEAMP